MSEAERQIEYYLAKHDFHDGESAFFGLLELKSATVQLLIEQFEREQDGERRSLLLEVIWQRRDPQAIPFLAKALQDVEPAIWKIALDGLVALASPEALFAVKRVRQAPCEAEFTAWLDEAIEQIEAALAATPRTTS